MSVTVVDSQLLDLFVGELIIELESARKVLTFFIQFFHFRIACNRLRLLCLVEILRLVLHRHFIGFIKTWINIDYLMLFVLHQIKVLTLFKTLFNWHFDQVLRIFQKFNIATFADDGSSWFDFIWAVLMIPIVEFIQ